MSDDFDPTQYVRAPMIDVPSGVALGVALLTALPTPTPDNVLNAANKVRQETVALQLAWGKSDSGGAPPDRRKADMRVDNAWGILLDRLEAYSLLPGAGFPRAPRARELVDIISPSNREWLNFAYGAEWAESTKRIERIEADGLAHDINELAGPEFLSEVQEAHTAYGIALGVTKPAHDTPEVNLAEPLRSLARAIGRYGIAVVGMVNDDPESVAVVRKALRPIDSFREGLARRIRAGGAAVEGAPEVPASPTTPVPEIK